jgi:hypothetical protein
VNLPGKSTKHSICISISPLLATCSSWIQLKICPPFPVFVGGFLIAHASLDHVHILLRGGMSIAPYQVRNSIVPPRVTCRSNYGTTTTVDFGLAPNYIICLKHGHIPQPFYTGADLARTLTIRNSIVS